METFVESRDLARAVAHTLKSASGADWPAIRLETGDDGRLAVSCTGGGRWSRSMVPAETMDGGTAYVPAKWLDAIIRAMPAGEIRVETIDGWLDLSGGGARLRLRELSEDADGIIMPAAPPLPDVMVEVDAEEFARIIGFTAPSAMNPREPGILHAIHLHSENGILSAEATDRSIASRAGMNVDGLPDGDWLIPGRWVANLHRVERIGVKDRTVVFEGGDDMDLTPILDGQYPNLDRMLSDDVIPDNVLRVDRNMMLGAAHMLKSVNLTGRAVIPIRIQTDDDGGLVMRLSDEDADGVQHLDAVLDGLEPPVGFMVNADYLIAALSALTDDEALIAPGDTTPGSRRPILVTDASRSGVHAVSPIREGVPAAA